MVLFPPPFYFVLISQTSYHTYKNNFKLRARSPHNGNNFSSIYMYVGMSVGMYVCRGPKSVGGNTWAKRAHAQSQYCAVKSDQ